MKKIRKYKKVILIGVILIFLLSLFYVKIRLNKKEDVVVSDNTTEIVKEEETKEEEVILCKVDIKGQVNTPGVYEVDNTHRVIDIINLAGGLKEDADTSLINLSKKVTDEMVIIIYSKEEVANSDVVKTVIKEVDNECVCPNIQNDGCINTNITDTIGGSSSEEEDSLININTADSDELQKLDGVGESKAKKIIEYREKNGNFNSIEDIMNVSGIGQTMYDKIKDYITV